MFRRMQGNPWAVLTVLCLGFFMTLLDLTVVTVAVPDMTDSLGASLDEILWVINAYTLALATLIITAGRMGDLRGKRNLFLAGVTLFTLASLACGLSQDAGQLIAFRGVQGIGAAMLMPQTLSIIADVFTDEKRGTALGIWGVVAGVSSAIGPTLGGLLVTHLDWRWIFFINLPIGALTLLLAVPILPRSGKTVRHRFDVPGVGLISAALFCLAFALTEGERYEWNTWIWTLIAAFGVLLAAFLVYERGQQDKEPLMPLQLFKDRNFTLANFVGVTASFGIIGLFVPATVYLQSVLGFSAQKTGLVLMASAVGTILIAGPAGVLSERFGGKFILMGGLLGFSAGLAWFALAAEPGTGWGTLVVPLFVVGLGAGCTFTPMASLVMRNVPAHLNGAASGVNNALRQIGSVVAGAVVGAVLQAKLASSLRDQAQQESQALPEEYRESFVEGFADAGSSGLDVGTEQAAKVPEGVSPEVADTFNSLAGKVFGDGFVDALQPTMFVSFGILIAGALACLALKGGAGAADSSHSLPVSRPQPDSADNTVLRG